jgi:hypothetical protein
MAIRETQKWDNGGNLAKYYSSGVEYAHSVWTHPGFARGGSVTPYDKDVIVCLGKLFHITLNPNQAKEYQACETFTIPEGTPSLAVALEDNFIFVNHRGVGESVRNPILKELKDKINSKEKDIEAVLKEFGIIRS